MVGAIERANHLILEFLKGGPRSATEILAVAEGASVSQRSVQRAAEQMGIVKTRTGFRGGWTWRLPDDESDGMDAPIVQPALNVVNDGEFAGREAKVQPRVEGTGSVKGREIPPPPDAKVIAARLRRLEEIRGKKAPIYAQDSRVMHWVELGIRDPDLREAYERAVTTLEDARSSAFISVGFLDPFVMQVISEGDKA